MRSVTPCSSTCARPGYLSMLQILRELADPPVGRRIEALRERATAVLAKIERGHVGKT